MEDSTNDQIKDIKHKIFLGKFNEAFSIINELVNTEDLNETDQLFLILYKSEILNKLGDQQEALEAIDKVLKKNIIEKDTLLHLDALIIKGDSLTRLGKHKEAQLIITKVEKLLDSQIEQKPKMLAYRKALLLEYKWWFHFTKGDVELVKDSLNQFIPIAKKSGNKRLICASLAGFAFYLSDIARNMQLAIEHLDKAQAIADEIDCDFERVRVGLIYSAVHAYTGKIQKSEDTLKKTIAIAEKKGFKTQLPMLYFYLGNFYSNLNKFDLALEYCLKAVAYRSTSSWAIYPLRIIGYAYHMKSDFDLAQEYYLKALEICRKVDEKRLQPWLLFNLADLAIQKDNLKEAEKYSDYLQDIVEKTKSESVDQLYRFTKAIIFKASSNMEDLIEAAKILKGLLEEDLIYKSLDFGISFAFLEIRLRELQFSPNQAKLKELEKQISNLLKEAKKHQYQILILEIYMLKSQLALLNYDPNEAANLLKEARELAEKQGLKLHVQIITKEQEEFEKQQKTWQQLQDKKAPLDETVKQVKIDNTIKRITQETVLEKRDEKTGEIIEFRKIYSLKI